MEFLEYPFAQPHHPGLSLEAWIQSERFALEPAHRMLLACIIPLDIRAKKSTGGLSFNGLIKGVIRRMRDLKRVYGQDNLMESSAKKFYDLAQSVQVDTGALRRISWYAPGSQGKRIPLTGMQGEIYIQGELAPSSPYSRPGPCSGSGPTSPMGWGGLGS